MTIGIRPMVMLPYLGLAAFGPPEAGWFFGRDLVTADLVARLDERLAGWAPGGGGPIGGGGSPRCWPPG